MARRAVPAVSRHLGRPACSSNTPDLGPGPSRERLAGLRQDLRDSQRWGALAVVAESGANAEDDGRHWDLLRAWSHVGRVPEAISLLDRLLPGDDGIADLEEDRAASAGHLLQAAGMPERSTRYLRRAAQATTDPCRRLELTAEAVRIALSRGCRDEADDLISNICDADGNIDDRTAEIGHGAMEKLAGLCQQLGRYDDAERLYQGALDLSRRAGREAFSTVLACLSGLAGAARRRTQVWRAEHLLTLGIRYARVHRRPSEGRVLEANLAAVQYQDNRPEEALRTYRALQRAARLEGHDRLLPFAGLGIGTIQRERGEFLGALVTFRRAARDASRPA